MTKLAKTMAAACLIAAAWAAPAGAAAIHDVAQFNDFVLPANDDESAGPVSLGFGINFYGNTYGQTYVNNNGNITFTGAMSTFTPFNLLSTSTPIIAPFFADVKTSVANGGSVTYGTGTIDGRSAFGVNWIDVAYFGATNGLRNSFQLILIDRSDVGAGDFDFEFNYDAIAWEAGTASDGVGGLGGHSARAGWSNGVNAAFELTGSAVNGAFLDGNPATGLIHNSLDSQVDGRYVFRVRNGQIVSQPDAVPEPATAGMLVAGIAGLAGLGRRRRIAR